MKIKLDQEGESHADEETEYYKKQFIITLTRTYKYNAWKWTANTPLTLVVCPLGR